MSKKSHRKKKYPPKAPATGGGAKGIIPAPRKTLAIDIEHIMLVSEILSTMGNDDLLKLQELLGNNIPFYQGYKLPDGNVAGILTIAASLGAWDCLMWLHEKIRTEHELLYIAAQDIDHFEKDCKTAAILLFEAIRNGHSGAERVLTNNLYWQIKNSNDQELAFLNEKFEGNSCFEQAKAEILAEDEKGQLNNPSVVLIPKKKEEQKRKKFGSGGGL